MNLLKKVVPLSQAAKLSGYNQDYLGYLIRVGEIKGQKVGRGWVTTEEEIKNYLLKQKIRQKKLALLDFFTRERNKKIILTTIILFVVSFSTWFYILDHKNFHATGVQSSLTSESEKLQEKEN